MALIGRPGLSTSPFVTLGSSPARALWAGDNRLFAAGGTHFYELKNDGTVLTDYGAMSGSGGVGNCSIIANGTQLLCMDRSAAQVFNVDPGGPSMNPVWDGVALEYLDGFYIAITTGADLVGANPNQINVSANGDGTMWDALDYVIRTSAADLTIALAVLNSQLWIFGQKTIDIWYDAGNPLFPFARMQGAQINLGCMSDASVVKFYNTVMWLGADDRGYPQVYMTKGLSPVRVSNPSIEYLIGRSSAATLSIAWAFGYQEAGHTFYVLNLVNSSYQPLSTLVYDLTTGLWHERIYAGAWPVAYGSVSGFGASGPNFVCDGSSGNIYFQGIQYASDAGSSIVYTRTAPHLSDGNKRTSYSRFELDGDFGTSQPILSYSNDGGRNFNGWSYGLQQAQDQSIPSTFRRYYARQLGNSRDRVFKVVVTDDTNLQRWVNAFVDGEPSYE